VQALRSFAFSHRIDVTTGAASGPAVSIAVDGVYAAPASQDCHVQMSMGPVSFDARVVTLPGHVYLDKGDGPSAVRRSDAGYLGLCPSDRDFWKGFPSIPRALHGVVETHGRIRVERYDLARVADAARGLFGGVLPDGVSVDRLDFSVAAKGRWGVAADMRFSAGTDAGCKALSAEVDGVIVLTAPCSIARSFELTRFDDTAIVVKAPASPTTR
jgi:hypothetical protein